jgi:EAL domain-containing protein (putative c-di-GMP-specific phosphodiesterase class I)
LTQLPIDALKVDQSFVHKLTPDQNGSCTVGAALIVSAVIGMGKSLRHRVIAEGVETPEQLAFLQAQHCREGQGYYFSRPLVAEQFAKVLEAGKTHDPSDHGTPRIWRAPSVAPPLSHSR